MGMRFARGGRGDKKLRGFGDGCNDLEALMQSGNVNFNFPSRMISTSVQEVYVPNDVGLLLFALFKIFCYIRFKFIRFNTF